MKVVFSEIAKFKGKFFLLVLAALGLTFSMMLLPTFLGMIVDQAIPNKDYDQLYGIIGLMLVCVVAQIVCGVLQTKIASNISMGVGMNMRSGVFRKVQTLSQEEIDKFSTSSLITRTNGDINQVQTFLTQCLSYAVIAPVMIVVGVALAVNASPGLSAILVLMIPVLIIILIVVGKQAVPLSETIQTKMDTMNMVIREKLTGTRVIRAFGTTSFEERRFDDINTEYTGLNKKLLTLTNTILPLIMMLIGVTDAGIMLIAYFQQTSGTGRYTIGDVMTVTQYIMFILVAITFLTMVFILLPRAVTCANRAEEVMRSVSKIGNPDRPIEKTEHIEKRGYLEFKDVAFTYAGADIPAIKGLSFKAGPGETTAIIGGTGMGKSTIVNLIPRLYDVTEGQILLDGVDIRDYSIDNLRSKIGFVPQKAILFKGTIDSNLQFGDADATEERVEKAVKIAQSYDFVIGKENGFESEVAQGGTNFSGGQRQRLCIARALVRKPEVYVFDDSFSALDFKTDRNLRSALKPETKNATTIIVAQRVSTIMEADRIIVVERGEIAGIGTHHELLKSCDVYREIAASQLSKEEMDR